MLATEAWNFWEMLFYGFMVSWFHGFMVLGLFHKLRTLVVNNSETISKDTLLNKWNRVRDLGRDRWKIDLAGVRRIMRCSGSWHANVWKHFENANCGSDCMKGIWECAEQLWVHAVSDCMWKGIWQRVQSSSEYMQYLIAGASLLNRNIIATAWTLKQPSGIA